MDERLRRLQRQAQAGDPTAQEALERYRERSGICPIHGLPALDPPGWRNIGGEGCDECEEQIWCSDNNCDQPSCHRCFPDPECEYSHEKCDSYYDFSEDEGADEDEEFYDEEDDGRFDCHSCRGTGIGYPVDRSCRMCGGSGIARRTI